MIQMFPVDSHDRMIGVLPFFHSFGFTGTLWFPMVAGFGALYVPNPMDAKAVGELVGEVRRHDADRHADVLHGVHPQVLAGGVRDAALRDRGGGEAARADRARRSRRSSGSTSSKATAAPSCRRSCPRTTRTAPEGQVGAQARHGRPSAAGRRRARSSIRTPARPRR